MEATTQGHKRATGLRGPTLPVQGPQPQQHAAVGLFESPQLGKARQQAQVTASTSIGARQQRHGEPVRHLAAEPARDESGQRLVRVAGAGRQDEVAGRAGLAQRGEQPRRQERAQAGWGDKHHAIGE